MSDPIVLMVAYASDDHLDEALTALGGSLSVVVVDNGAEASTETIVRRQGAIYVRAPHNVGFAAGVNLGLAAAWDGTSDVLLLNPDARVGPEQIWTLQQALHAGTRTAAVGPLLIGTDGRPQRASWPMPSPAQVWWEALGLGRLWVGRRFVTGAVLLINGSTLAEIGQFDDRYFLYAEEADWQLRAIKAGWSVRVDPTVTVTHVGGASSTDPQARLRTFHTSGRIFGDRWNGRVGSAIFRLGKAAGACRRWLLQPGTRPEQRIVLSIYLARTGREAR